MDKEQALKSLEKSWAYRTRSLKDEMDRIDKMETATRKFLSSLNGEAEDATLDTLGVGYVTLSYKNTKAASNAVAKIIVNTSIERFEKSIDEATCESRRAAWKWMGTTPDGVEVIVKPATPHPTCRPKRVKQVQRSKWVSKSWSCELRNQPSGCTN